MWAKCSVCPASWKSARQSSGPPCGLITRITRSGISIGVQNARGSLSGRSSRSSSTFRCAWRSIAEIAERRLEGGQHPCGRERRVPAGAAPGAPDVPALDLVEPHRDARAEEAVAGLHPELLRRGEEAAALFGERVEREAEVAVELRVARDAEPLRLARHDFVRVQVQIVQVPVGQVVAQLLDVRPLLAVLLVHQPRAQHPIRDVLAVEARRQRRLELGDPLRLRAHEVSEVALARELPELAHAAVAVYGGAEPERRVELGQPLVPLVDRRELERLLLAREVEVGLLVHLRDETVGVDAQRLDLALSERFRHAGS